MNIYRGCSHNCVYCDGQTEKYQVMGDFETEIEVKINAPLLLEKELDKIEKNREKPGLIGLIGGVSDAYQPIEAEYKITRKILSILAERNFPVMLLTKSVLVERDIDLLKLINEKSNALVGMSFSSVDDAISRIFEPGVALPSSRLQTLAKMKQAGIRCGVFLMPLIPFVTDQWQRIKEVFQAAARLSLDFIVFGGLTLNPGRQSEKFFSVIDTHFPELAAEYAMIYKPNKWGNATDQYYQSLSEPMLELSRLYKIPLRIPFYSFDRQFTLNEKVIIILEHIDYLLKLKNQRSLYGFAAYNLSKLKEPIEQHQFFLQSVKGIGKVTEKIIQEIIRTGRSNYYNQLLSNR